MDRVDAVTAILRERGPISITQLIDALGDDRLTRDELLDEWDDEDITWLGDDLVALQEQWLDGRLFTHRLTQAEVDGGYLCTDPDLEPVVGCMSKSAELSGGGRVRWLTGSDAPTPWQARIGGPDGWLDSYGAGDVVALSWTNGVVSIAPSPQVTPNPAIAPALRAAFDAELRRDEPIAMSFGVFARLLATHPDMFTVTRAPLSDLLAEAGLELQDENVAVAGFDWDGYWESKRDEFASGLAQEHGLDELDGRLLATLAHGYLDAWNPDGGARLIDGDLLEDVAAALMSPLATAAWLGPVKGPLCAPADDDAVVRLDGLADQIIARTGHTPAGALMVKARIAEARGDALAHERWVKQALAADADFSMALHDGAYIASERGDARRMLTMLERVGPIDPLAFAIAQTFSEPGPNVAGRNERCPCSGGRKYKDCCARFYGHGPTARVLWLMHKANAFIRREPRFGDLWNLACATAGVDPAVAEFEPQNDETAALRQEAWDESALRDLALFEGGGLEQFVAERGVLLPGDEREVATRWAALRHRVLGVGALRPEVNALAVVDMITDEKLIVCSHRSLEEAAVGHVRLVVVLPLPGDATWLWSPGIPIDDERVEAVKTLVESQPTATQLAADVLAPYIESSLMTHHDASR